MNVCCMIPARGGSKGLPKKNIKLLNGKPLIAYSIEKALECNLRTIVDTDNQEIADVAKSFGAEVMFRPDSLARDKTSMFDLLKTEVFKIDPLPDIVVLLQPTVPLRNKIHIKWSVEMLEKWWDKYDSVVTVEKIPEKYHPMTAIISTPNGARMLFSKVSSWLKGWWTGERYEGPVWSGFPLSQRVTRRQDHPEAFVPSGAVYTFKTENLKTSGFYGENVLLIESDPVININDQSDFDKVEELCKMKNVTTADKT